jgi:predicted amidohydrolase YtcJ
MKCRMAIARSVRVTLVMVSLLTMGGGHPLTASATVASLVSPLVSIEEPPAASSPQQQSSPDRAAPKLSRASSTYLPLAPKGWDAARADIILHSGTVLTIEASPAQAQAIAVRGDSILAIGSNISMLAFRGPGTRLIDLGGRTLLPGLADGHTHVLRQAGNAGKTIDEAIDLALSHGLTSITEMLGDNDYVNELLTAQAEGRLRLRVNLFPSYNRAWLDNEGHWLYEGAYFPDHDPILDSGRRLRIPGVKIFADGAGIAPRGCPAMTIPYQGASTNPSFFDTCFDIRGDLYLSQDGLSQAVASLQDKGFRVAFHTMGDRGIDTVVNAIEYALDGASNSVYRHQVQHSGFMRPDQIDRYAALGILSSLRGTWNFCNQEGIRVSWPDHYTQWVNRFALPGRGVHAFAEGDFDWTSDPADRTAGLTIDTMLQLWALVTRQQLQEDGSTCQPEDWMTEHEISVPQALRMLTIEPAYAVSQESVLGSLKAGKFADMVVLSGNPLTVEPDTLKDLVVLMTMVGGDVEYCRPGSEALCPSGT